MESLTLNVRVDANDKKCFEQFCSNVGMNVSTAINMFIKAVIREQKLPFEIKLDEEYICLSSLNAPYIHKQAMTKPLQSFLMFLLKSGHFMKEF